MKITEPFWRLAVLALSVVLGALGATGTEKAPRKLDTGIEVYAFPQPDFPQKLAKKGIVSGEATLALTVDSRGHLCEWLVLESTDVAIAYAIGEVIEDWSFSPARRAGVPVLANQIFPVRISAESDETYLSPVGPASFSVEGALRKASERSHQSAVRLRPLVFAEAWDLDFYPTLISRVEPEIPEDAMDESFGGAVVFEFYIDRKGRVCMPKLYGGLELVSQEAALAAQAALREWRFEPVSVAGRPAITRVRQRFEFNHILARM